MNSILLKFQKSSFISLSIVVLFFSVSVGYLAKSIIIIILLLLNPPQMQSIQKSPQKIIQNTNQTLPISIYEEMIEGNMIRGKLNPDEPQTAQKGQDPKKERSLTQEEVPGSDEMLIVGTISGSPSFARVAILEKGRPESEEYSVGNTVGGYKVKAILQHFVVLDKNGVALKVEVGEKVGEARKRYLEKSKEDEAATSEDIASAETHKKLISREDINKYMKNPTKIYENGQFGPNIVNGKIDGYKLHQVGKANILYSLGARSGDTIKRVNGMPLNDTGKMFEIWNSVKGANKIIVDLERKGQTVTYEFTVQN